MNNIILSDDSVILQNRFFDIYTGELIAPIQTPNYTVVQVAESYYLNRFQVDAHRQICDLEITLPLTSGIVGTTNNSTCKLSRKQPYLSFRGEVHKLLCTKSGRFQTLAVNIKEGPCLNLFSSVEQRFRDSEQCISTNISSQMSLIITEFTSTSLPHSVLQLDCLITEIMIMLSRDGLTAKAPDLTSQKLLPAIINYLDNHFLELDNAEMLSLKFGYSYSHICKVFKSVYKTSPGAYLHKKRMEYAQEAVSAGRKLSDISEVLGYSSIFNFSRAYKKHFGVSPSHDRPSRVQK